MAQITEKVFRKSLNQYVNTLWFQKFQVLPMTFTKAPADYIILANNYRYLVECKECDCRYKNSSFDFKRITQLRTLIDFEEFHPHQKSYLLIMFRKRRINDSDAYMIPIKELLKFKKLIDKKSGNMQDFKDHLEDYRISTKKSHFKLGRWFE